MRKILGYELTVRRGERAGLVKHYGSTEGVRARRFADRLDREYGAICASVRPVFGLELDTSAAFAAEIPEA